MRICHEAVDRYSIAEVLRYCRSILLVVTYCLFMLNLERAPWDIEDYWSCQPFGWKLSGRKYFCLDMHGQFHSLWTLYAFIHFSILDNLPHKIRKRFHTTEIGQIKCGWAMIYELAHFFFFFSIFLMIAFNIWIGM